MAVNFYSQESAEQVRLALDDACEEDGVRDFFTLKIVGLGDGAEVLSPPLSVREVRDRQYLADGRTVVHCKNRHGRKLDIYLPREVDQSTGIAEVLIEEDDIPLG